MEDDLLKKTSFNGKGPSMEEIILKLPLIIAPFLRTFNKLQFSPPMLLAILPHSFILIVSICHRAEPVELAVLEVSNIDLASNTLHSLSLKKIIFPDTLLYKNIPTARLVDHRLPLSRLP